MEQMKNVRNTVDANGCASSDNGNGIQFRLKLSQNKIVKYIKISLFHG